jgi:hypothetical protein
LDGLAVLRYVAVIITSIAFETRPVGMVTVAVLFPVPTVTLEGGRASCPLLVNATTAAREVTNSRLAGLLTELSVVRVPRRRCPELNRARVYRDGFGETD